MTERVQGVAGAPATVGVERGARPAFRDRVRGAGAERLWLYEAVPPREGLTPEKVQQRLQRIEDALGGLRARLAAFFIPDIDPQEVGFGTKPTPDTTWLDARAYAELLRRHLGDAETVICRSSVGHSEERHHGWLQESWAQRFHALVAVGGDTRQKAYAGPSPERFAELVGGLRAARGMDFAIGGICLPQRGMVNRYADASFQPDPDLEPRRMLEKNALGVEFFMMQIQFDAEDALRVMRRYTRACREQGRPASRVFCGLAPVTAPRDWDFMRYLGVNVPPAVQAEIGDDPATMGARSIEHITRMMRAVNERLDAEAAGRIDVCIECTAPRNVNAAADLLGRLLERS